PGAAAPPGSAAPGDDDAARSSPRVDDWRLAFAGLLEPERSGSPPDSEREEVEIPFFPITESEAKKFEERQRAASVSGEPSQFEVAEVVEPLTVLSSIRPKHRRRTRSAGGSADSCAERYLRQALLDAG
ncbi:MAG: hypothetical protein L0L30_16340, partial [Brevibacterium sp.]|nr:hypothetical protein [Brevibacterium sp.]